MIINGIQLPIASFEEWKQQKARNLDAEDPMVTCGSCDGTGVDDCPCCGSENDCDECDALGEVRFSRADTMTKKKALSHQKYVEEVVRDAQTACSWMGESFDEIKGELVAALKQSTQSATRNPA